MGIRVIRQRLGIYESKMYGHQGGGRGMQEEAVKECRKE
jgi:hypothetical protein